MRFTVLFSMILALIVLAGCDPKVNQRQPRFDPNDCPACKTGVCTYCDGAKTCKHCDGKGTRTTSTKNYTGESVKLIDYKEQCPFCNATGVCSYCKGSGKCATCNGTGKTAKWEPGSVSSTPEVNEQAASLGKPSADTAKTADATKPADTTQTK